MLKRSFVAFITSVILAAPVVALGQTDDRFDRTLVAVTDPRQVTISAALILAGYAGEPDDPAAVPLREEIRKGLATVDPDLKRRLSEFYTANRRPTLDEATDAIRYRSLGVLANMPPSFSIAVPQDRIPIDLRDILGFASLAGELYRTPAFRALLPRLIEISDLATRQAGSVVKPTVVAVLDYLRTQPIPVINVTALRNPEGKVTRPAMTRIRKLKVYIDPLLSSRRIAVRGDLIDAGDEPDHQLQGDRYAVFAGPAIAFEDTALRLGVLKFTLDPIVQRNREEIESNRAKIDEILADNPPAFERYARAPISLVSDSLVSAINARFLEKEGRSRNAAVASVADAHMRGELLTMHFYSRLQRYEEVGLDIGVFFADLLRSLSPTAEIGREKEFIAARTAYEAERKVNAANATEFAGEILTADRLIKEKKFTDARPILERVLRTSANNARAIFGLAQIIENTPDPIERDAAASDDERIMAQEERLEAAVNLYRMAALHSNSRELWLASWSHVYAGRILDFLELREDAVAEYQAAVKVGDVPEGAFKEAQAGLTAPYVPPGTVKP
ncbi:MAG: hypothetical protein IPF82_15880 [Blastocatellia bacterium]|nr:hypothetical protein [Blastocatellia bacterium]